MIHRYIDHKPSNLPTDSPSSAFPGLLMRRTKPGSRESARDEFDGSEKNMVYISGKLTVCELENGQ